MPVFVAQSVEEAIFKGLKSLDVTREESTITILQEPKKGILGFGKKEARVEIELKKQTIEPIIESQDEVVDIEVEPQKQEIEISTTLSTEESILEELRVYLETIANELISTEEVTVTIEPKKEMTVFQIYTTKQGMLIGKHGKTLNALQYLAQVFLHRKWKSKRSIVVNVGDYREKRQEILERLAERTAQKVVQTKRPIFLEPMPAFERKQIHAVLSKNQAVQTHSEGDEPYRYLVIESKQ